MAYAGQTLENPASGERITFRQTAAETGGELVAIDLQLPPNRRGPGRVAPPPAPGGALPGRRGNDALPDGAAASRRRPRRGRRRPSRREARFRERRRRRGARPRGGAARAEDGAALRDCGGTCPAGAHHVRGHPEAAGSRPVRRGVQGRGARGFPPSGCSASSSPRSPRSPGAEVAHSRRPRWRQRDASPPQSTRDRQTTRNWRTHDRQR